MEKMALIEVQSRIRRKKSKVTFGLAFFSLKAARPDLSAVSHSTGKMNKPVPAKGQSPEAKNKKTTFRWSFRGTICLSSLTKEWLQRIAARAVPEAACRFFFDLANALTREIIFLTNLFQRHGVLTIKSEVVRNDIRLALREC